MVAGLRAGAAGLLLAVFLLAFAGCGGQKGRPDADPASAAPRDADLYLEAEVRPKDAGGRAARAELLRLAGGRGEIARLLERFDEEALEDKISFAKDVRPWIGRRVGVFVSLAPDEAALVAPARDPAAAREALERVLKLDEGEGEVREARYRGTRLSVRGEDAAAVSRGVALVGNRSSVEEAIDALRGRGLAASRTYRTAVRALPAGRVATAYAAAGVLPELFERSVPGGRAAAGTGLDFLGLSPEAPHAAALRAGDRAISLELGVRPGRRAGPKLAKVSEAPLAIVVADLGRWGRRLLAAFGQIDPAAAARFAGRVRAELGVGPEELLSLAGDAAAFYRGTDGPSLSTGVVVRARDPRRLDAVVERMARRLLGHLPQVRLPPGAQAGRYVRVPAGTEIAIARVGRGAVGALGRNAYSESLRPTRVLGDGRLFRDARAALGRNARPSSLFDAATLLRLAERGDAGDGDEDTEKAAPYLRRLRAFVTGTADGGRPGTRLAKLVLLLR